MSERRKIAERREAERDGWMDAYAGEPPYPRGGEHEHFAYRRGYDKGRRDRQRLIAEITERVAASVQENQP
jgi:hypothetical protein